MILEKVCIPTGYLRFAISSNFYAKIVKNKQFSKKLERTKQLGLRKPLPSGSYASRSIFFAAH